MYPPDGNAVRRRRTHSGCLPGGGTVEVSRKRRNCPADGAAADALRRDGTHFPDKCGMRQTGEPRRRAFAKKNLPAGIHRRANDNFDFA